MSKVRWVTLLSLVSLSLGWNTGCGGGSNPMEVMVIVTPSTATVQAGGTQQFTANTAVTWTLTQGTPPTPCPPATCGTLSSPTANPVTYTAPTTPPSTTLTVTITATSQADSSMSSSATITVPAITVSVAPSTATVAASATQVFTATVMNTTNTAVTWTLTHGTPPTPCPPATCGTLSSTTANPVTYTAPSSVPANAKVILTATSVADPTMSGIATITVTTTAAACPSGNEKIMHGQYAFLFQGYDASGPVAIGGTFDADGTGKVATVVGVEDINNSAGVQKSISISSAGSSYSVGPDNRGCLTIATILSLAPVTYRFALGSLNASSVATSGRMIEFDGSGTLGSGVIRLQDPTAFLTSAVNGNYAFGASSTLSLSLTTLNRFAIAGAFTTNGTGGITGGELDTNSNGTIDGGTAGASPLSIINSSSYSVAGNGRGTLTLHFGAVATPVNASFYVVSASELLAMSIDSQSVNSLFAGSALLQSGEPFSTSSLSGNDVFALAGLCGTCGPGGSVAPHLSVGAVNFPTPGSFTLNDDANKGGTLSTESHTGTYTVDSSGRVAITIAPTSAVGGIIYLVSANQGFMVIFDNSVQTGTLEPQTGAPFNNASLNGTLFSGTTIPVNQLVTDTSGVATFDGVGTVSGTSDSASIGSSPSTPNLNPGQAFNQSYSVTNGTGTPGRGTISSMVSSGGTTNLIFYIVSPSKIVLMDATASAYPAITIGEK